MREGTTYIKTHLQRGLRREIKSSFNADALTVCQGLIAHPSGLVKPTNIVNPFTGVTVSGQFPQFIKGQMVNFLGQSTAIGSLSSTYALTNIPTYSPASPATPASITAGGQWHLVDFGTSWALLNGSCVVWKQGSAVTASPVAMVQNRVSMQTGCAFRGRAIYGGFDGANFWNGVSSADRWTEYFDDWEERYEAVAGNKDLSMTTKVGSNWVWWSSIMAEDAWSLFNRGAYTTDELGISTTRIYDAWTRNEMGMVPMSWNGTVYRVLPMTDGIMVYGSGGISKLLPITEPFSTFGIQEIAGAEVMGRGHVAGTKNVHFCLDSFGDLLRLTADGGIERLGYREFFSPYLSQNIVLSMNEAENELYISVFNATSGAAICGYVLTSSGLTQANLVPTNVTYDRGQLVGAYSGSVASTFSVTTTMQDFQVRGLKFIRALAVGGQGLSDVTVQATGYYDNGTIAVGTSVPVNDIGSGTVMMAGDRFKFTVEGTAADEASLDYILVSWSLVDKRHIRGPYAAGASQSDSGE